MSLGTRKRGDEMQKVIIRIIIEILLPLIEK